MDLNSNEERRINEEDDDDAFVSSITFDTQAASSLSRPQPSPQPSSSPYHHRHKNYSNDCSDDTVASNVPFHRTNVGIIRIHRDYLHDLDDDIIRTLLLSSSSTKKKKITTTTAGNNTINPMIKIISDEQRTKPIIGSEPNIDTTNAGTNDTIRRNNSETHTHDNNRVRNQGNDPTDDDGNETLNRQRKYDEEANHAQQYHHQQQQRLDTNNEYDLSGQINSRLLGDCEVLLVRRRNAKQRYDTVWNIATYIWIVSLVVMTILLLAGRDRTQQSQTTTTSTTVRRDAVVVAIVIGNFVVAVGLFLLYTTYKSIDNEIQHIIKLVLPNSEHDDDDENFVNRTTTMELGNEKEYRAMIDDQNNTNNTNTKIRHTTDGRVGYKPPPPHHVHAHVPVGQIRRPPPPHGGVSDGGVKGYKNRSNNRHHPLRRSNESQQALEKIPEPKPKRFNCK